MTKDPTDPPDDETETWVDLPPARPGLHVMTRNGTDPDIDEPDQSPSPEDGWLLLFPKSSAAPVGGMMPRWWVGVRDRMPTGAWAALAAVVIVLAGVAAGMSTDTAATGKQVQATAVPPSSSATPQGPCTGLSGTVITERAGDSNTLEDVIASFEAAYYIDRDAVKAIALVAPETGITVERLAGGIATTPPGARHCVAITPIAPDAANVHIAVVHPDHPRVDYRQQINTRPAENGGALLITKFKNNE